MAVLKSTPWALQMVENSHQGGRDLHPEVGVGVRLGGRRGRGVSSSSEDQFCDCLPQALQVPGKVAI